MNIWKSFFIIIVLFSSAIVFPYRLSIILPVYGDDIQTESYIAALVKDPMFFEYQVLILYIGATSSYQDMIKYYCQQYTNIEHYRFDKDPGAGALLNWAITKSRSNYITQSGTNLRYARYAFDVMMEFLDIHDWGKIVYAGYYNVAHPLDDYYEVFMSKDKKEIIQDPKTSSYVTIWKKEIHSQQGLFDEQSASCQKDFWNVILANSYVAMFYPYTVAAVGPIAQKGVRP